MRLVLSSLFSPERRAFHCSVGFKWSCSPYDPLKASRNPRRAGGYDCFRAVTRPKHHPIDPIALESFYDALGARRSLGELPNWVLGALFIER
jgi:hypothetical protein